MKRDINDDLIQSLVLKTRYNPSKNPMRIIPAILSDSKDVVQDQLDSLHSHTKFTQIQVDIVDPEFADNITLAPIDFMDVNLHGFNVEFHLMTNDPINDVVECSQIPGVKVIIAQIEHMSSQRDFYEHVNSYGIETGLSLDLFTPVEELDPEVLQHLSIVQVMGNKAGAQGEQFAGEVVLTKIRELSKIAAQQPTPFQISVDIGMNAETILLCSTAGASVFVVGSFLWKAPNLEAAVEQLSINK